MLSAYPVHVLLQNLAIYIDIYHTQNPTHHIIIYTYIFYMLLLHVVHIYQASRLRRNKQRQLVLESIVRLRFIRYIGRHFLVQHMPYVVSVCVAT